jgi:hypothetical protein
MVSFMQGTTGLGLILFLPFIVKHIELVLLQLNY